MKLIRWGNPGKEKTGVLINDIKYDTSAFGEDYNEQFFETDGLARLKKFLADHSGKLQQVGANERLGSPVARPSKILCIGLNYADHAKETGVALPTEPVLFLKSTTALGGPFDDVVIPKDSVKTDWEVELAIVIGKKASYVDEADALNYVAGYMLHNDVTERGFQFERGGTWDKGKGCDTFAPMGPFMATADEIKDIDNMRLWLKVNGKTMQDGNTSNFIFNVPVVIAYVSKFMTLLPGDIISTGTPAGVGLGFNPPIYLKAGDVMELGIDGLGESKQVLKAYVKN
ncbi:fumarylacetoacetate hydrolase family protein [Mucilaginibacter sp.]|uniref:fumarylacetoacetate hydrolase family protein n=1 Tax=Mucilaginibacter sp. TaxID=1882438 RepID=UPI00260F3BD6|nr:fumarylacetoacetate hydrolase family protein [Mucilaginibacter sp.]MDB4927319.1 ureidoglycolate lyase [Mucilaginibacter sp.]